MRKKLICLLLCLVVVILPLAMTGCGNSTTTDTDEESSSRPAVSINLWLVSDKEVSAETEAAIEEALNEITQSKYTTKVDLVYFTYDEYYAALDAKLEAAKKYKEEHTSTAITLPGIAQSTETTEETTAETVVNELGQRLLKYPDINEGQLDIIFIDGKDKLRALADAGELSTLDTNLNASSKILKEYIYPSFLEQIKYNKNTYAIPVNHQIGQYTYLLVNKALAEKYYIDVSSLNSFAACGDLVEEIGRHESDVAPVLAYADPVNMYYWLGGDTPSLFASYVPTAATLGSRTTMRSAFDTVGFTEHMLLMKKCEDNGWFAADPENTEAFGVAIMTGDYDLRDKYAENYDVKVLTSPTLTEDVAYQAMFAVSAYTANLDRAMEVITLLNTDAATKNLLQYGIDGVNYELDDDGALVYLNDAYRMTNLYTGNTLLSYPAPGEAANSRDDGKAANRDSRISPYFGLSDVADEIDQDLVAEMRTLSDTYMERMYACANAAELADFFENAKTELYADPTYKAAFSVGDDSKSPYAVYARWFEKLWPSAE